MPDDLRATGSRAATYAPLSDLKLVELISRELHSRFIPGEYVQGSCWLDARVVLAALKFNGYRIEPPDA